MKERAGERGQASVELVALLPVLLLVAVAAVQMLVVGYSAVLAGNAAEAGALTLAARGDPEAAARSALPGWSRKRVEVAVKGGHVRVRVRPPVLLGPLARELEVTAEAAVEAP